MSKERTSTIPDRLLICGASARSAAFSALRAGIQPVCADLFADEDLRRVAPTVRIHNYPGGIAATAAELPPADWIYTGALENFPEQIAHIADRRTLLGNGTATLARVRDPLAVVRCLQNHGLPVLEVRDHEHPPPCNGTWVRKPLRSAGGASIRIWDAAEANEPSRQPVYFQRVGEGEAYSALFLAFPNGAELIGITRQLVGVPEFHATRFAYCGSIGPLALPDAVERQIQEMGARIAEFVSLRGLFGCDFLYDGATAWLTEVNPRYTASVEVYERCWNIPLLGWHCRACLADGEATTQQNFRRQIVASREGQAGVAAKAVLFAQETCSVPALEDRFPTPRFPWQPQIADIPAPGSTIAAGHPVCTVFANGKTAEEGLAQILKNSIAIGANP